MPTTALLRRPLHIARRWLLARPPLGVTLGVLRVLAVGGSVSVGIRNWAVEGLGLRGAALRTWVRRAWWGREASFGIGLRLHRGDAREVEKRVLPVDWSRVDEALARGRGLVLISGHVGPHGVAAHVVAKRFPEALFLFEQEARGPRGLDVRGVEDAGTRASSLTEAHLHLRRGGIVFVVADGRHGDRFVIRSFLGRPVRMGIGAAVLARLSGAPSIPTAALWQGDRLRIEFAPPIAPRTADAEAWQMEWMDMYLVWLEGHLRGPAENLRLMGGLWVRDAGGVV
jgi:hypothetical protein